MRALLPLCLLALAAASSAVAVPHVVNEFSITIPNMAATPGADSLSGDVFAVLTTAGISAVNLSTKAVLWNYASESASDFFISGSNVLVVGDEYVEGLDLTSGTSVWKNTTVMTYSDASAIKFATLGDNVVVTTEDQLFSVNVATGVFAFQKSLNGSPVQAGGLVFYSNANSELVALNLTTGITAWSKTASAGGSFNNVLFANDMYVVTSIDTIAGDTVLYVVYAATGNRKLKLEGMQGLNEDDGPVSISGSNLTVVAGDNPREYTIDLNTGYILAQKPYSGGGSGGNGGGNPGAYSLTLASGDVLAIHSTSSHTTPALYGEGFSIKKNGMTVCPHTPSYKHFNMAYIGDGLLKVGTLQGWVLFYIQDSTCTVISQNEKAPGYRTHKDGVVYKFGQDFIEVEGTQIIGYKIVQ